YVISLMIHEALTGAGLEPAWCAGRGAGEYAALVAAGALSFEDGLRLVIGRNEAVAAAFEACPGASLEVTGLDDEIVEATCRSTDDDVWIAGFLGEGHCVVAGTTFAVELVRKELQAQRGVDTDERPQLGALNTSLMAPARAMLRELVGAV